MSANAVGWTAVTAVLLIVAGFALVWPPLGLVAAGVVLLGYAILSATSKKPDQGEDSQP